MDNSKENAQYDAVRKAVNQTNLSAPLRIKDKSVAAPTSRLPCGWYHRVCSTRTSRGQQGKSLHSRPPMPQHPTAPPIGFKPSSPLKVETAGNRDDPVLWGNDAVTAEMMNPQNKVCLLTGIRNKIRDVCGKWRWKTSKDLCWLLRRRQTLSIFF